MSDFLDLQGAKDLNTDAIHLSAVANSKDQVTGAPIDTHVNRAGGVDYTLKGFWGALGPVVMPWTSVVGGTLTQPNQAFLHPANGNYYSWGGAYPVGGHVVAPGTDPTLPGSGYVPRTDVVLRGALAGETGAALVGRAGGTVADVMPKKGDITINIPADYSSLTDALVAISDWRFPEHTVTIRASGELVSAAPVIVSHVDAERLHIVGDDLIALSASSVTISTYATPTTTVSMTLTDSTNVDVGDWLYIHDSQGSGPYKLIEGCWKVSSKVGNVITYDVRSWAKVPSTVTIASVSVEKFTSVLQFNNCDGVVTKSRLGLLDKVAVIGNSDDYWLSSNVSGTEKGTHGIYAGGLSVVVNTWNDPAQGCASITLGERVGVNGFDQQGIVCDQSSSIFAYRVASCNNKRRGFYAAGGKIRNKFAIANGNFYDGCIADYGASVESSGLVAAGNGSAGVSGVNGASAVVPNGFYHLNAINIQARKGGYVEAAKSNMQDATLRDVLAEVGSSVTATVCTLNSTTESVRATGRSFVDVSECTFNPSASLHINAQESGVIHSDSVNATKFSSTNSHIRNNSTYQEYRNSTNFRSLGYVYGVDQLRIFSPTQPAEFAKVQPSSGGDVFIGSSVGNILAMKRAGDAVYPAFGDNATTCGRSTDRWSVVYAGTGTINTSDAREKSQPLAIDDAVLDAWGDVQFITFQWLSSVAQKGDSARWHFGVIAQHVRDAFIAHGLDGTKYGLLCYDEWESEYEQIISTEVVDGEIVSKETGEMRVVREAGNRWGIRPDQCLFLEAAYQRRSHQRLLDRIEALESK